jgi:hypothetical protein
MGNRLRWSRYNCNADGAWHASTNSTQWRVTWKCWFCSLCCTGSCTQGNVTSGEPMAGYAPLLRIRGFLLLLANVQFRLMDVHHFVS